MSRKHMPILSKDIKLLTLSLLLRTMPKNEQTLLAAHFSPEVVKRLSEIEKETGEDVEKLDWTPFYQMWPELQKILSDCKEEIKGQKLIQFGDEQRPRLREYILSKTGRQRKTAPVLLSKEIMQIVDHFIASMK